jgi:hypothetical protein
MVEVVRHFAVVASFVVEFGASRRGFTIINCRSNSGGGECASAKYSLSFKILVVEADDVTRPDTVHAMGQVRVIHPSDGKALTLVGEEGFC